MQQSFLHVKRLAVAGLRLLAPNDASLRGKIVPPIVKKHAGRQSQVVHHDAGLLKCAVGVCRQRRHVIGNILGPNLIGPRCAILECKRAIHLADLLSDLPFEAQERSIFGEAKRDGIDDVRLMGDDFHFHARRRGIL